MARVADNEATAQLVFYQGGNTTMPKLKTVRGAAKRFKKTAKGHFKHAQSHKNHILTKKSTKRLRHLRHMALVHPSDEGGIARLLPHM